MLNNKTTQFDFINNNNLFLHLRNKCSTNCSNKFGYAIDSGIAYFKQPQNSVCTIINNGRATATLKLIKPPAGITINNNMY